MLTNPYSLPTIITGHRNIGSPYMLAVQGMTESSPVHPITLSIPTTAVRMLVRWYVRLPVPLVQQSVSQSTSPPAILVISLFHMSICPPA